MAERTAYKVDLRSMAALCESNYLRLGRLLRVAFADVLGGSSTELWGSQSLESGASAFIRLPAIDAALCLQICDVAPYTTTIRIQKCPVEMASSKKALDSLDSAALSSEPFTAWSMSMSLQVKVYHDLRMAEVADYAGAGVGRSRNDYPNSAMLAVDERDQQNRMLSEWLRYALENGVKPVAGLDMSRDGQERVFPPERSRAVETGKVSNG